MKKNDCQFCKIQVKHDIIAKNEFAVAFYDAFPVTKYHTLIIPKRHISDYFELNKSEIEAIHKLLKEQKEQLKKIDDMITGFNIGVNIGKDAGQTIFHAHIHLIPRRAGDMDEPKGGVRGVIPENQSY